MFNKTRTHLQMQRSVKPSLQLLLRQRAADQQQPDNFIHPAPASCRSQETDLCVCECASPRAIDEAVRERMRLVHHQSLSLLLSVALSSLCALHPSLQNSPFILHPASHTQSSSAHLHHSHLYLPTMLLNAMLLQCAHMALRTAVNVHEVIKAKTWN